MDGDLSTGEVVDEAVRRRPTDRVRAAVVGYHAYRQRGVAPALHRGLPSPYLTLIFTIDEPLYIAQQVDRRRPGRSYDAIAGGLHSAPAIIKHDGAQSGIQLLVDPLAARALFGVPGGELVSYDGEASDVLGTVATEIHDQLRDATTWAHRFTILDRVLGRVLSRDDVGAPPDAVMHAWQLLLASGGRAPVRALASAVGYSERHLANQFSVELGLTPKTAARVIRFDRARRALPGGPTNPPARIGDIAARCGYYDQSHLVRDFVDFAGCSPSRWLAEEFGNVQAAAVTDAGDLSA